MPLSLYDPYRMIKVTSKNDKSPVYSTTNSIITEKIESRHARAKSQMVNYLMKIEDESEIKALSE